MTHLLELLLILILIILLAKLGAYFATKIHQPAVFGEILMGLILGPSILNVMGWSVFADGGGSASISATIDDLGEIGVILLMFLAGLETDLKKMMEVGAAAFFSAAGGVILPFGLGTWLSLLFGYGIYESLFIGIVLTATSVSISAQTMMELGVLRTKEGMTILGAAVIDDVMGIVALSLVLAFHPQSVHVDSEGGGILGILTGFLESAGFSGTGLELWRIALIVVLMGVFFVAAILLFRYVFRRFLEAFDSLPISEGLLAASIAIAFLYSFGSQYLGNLAPITGSYTAGILIGLTRSREKVIERIHPILYSIFVPIFFISIGLKADTRPVFEPLARLFAGGAAGGQWNLFIFAMLILAASIIGKIVGCFAPLPYCKFKFIESLRVGVGMMSRGEVGLIIALVGLSSGIIQQDIYTTAILMVLVTTLATPIALRLVRKGWSDETEKS